jgi:hypothetical protein
MISSQKLRPLDHEAGQFHFEVKLVIRLRILLLSVLFPAPFFVSVKWAWREKRGGCAGHNKRLFNEWEGKFLGDETYSVVSTKTYLKCKCLLNVKR